MYIHEVADGDKQAHRVDAVVAEQSPGRWNLVILCTVLEAKNAAGKHNHVSTKLV